MLSSEYAEKIRQILNADLLKFHSFIQKICGRKCACTALIFKCEACRRECHIVLRISYELKILIFNFYIAQLTLSSHATKIVFNVGLISRSWITALFFDNITLIAGPLCVRTSHN